VLHGAGAALLPGLLVEPDIAAGTRTMLALDTGPPVEIWALYRSRRLLSVKVRAFLDTLDQLDAAQTQPKRSQTSRSRSR
jgi:DNA-binding transcriptional LysR family regulator